jgi:hypothetical protein
MILLDPPPRFGEESYIASAKHVPVVRLNSIPFLASQFSRISPLFAESILRVFGSAHPKHFFRLPLDGD